MTQDLQKASMWKRISAFLFDFIMLSIVAVLMALLLSAALGYDQLNKTVEEAYEAYGQAYGVDLRMSSAEYEQLTREEAQRVDDAFEALNNDRQAVRAHGMMLQQSVLIVSLGFFFAYLIWEFLIPLRFKDGQTLGKKIFGVGLMKQDGIKVNGVTLFIRAILGKYTIETMIPVLILLMIYWGTIGVVGPAVIFLILLVEVIVMISTPTNALIHDLLAGTVVIDEASQRIFESREEMIAYKEKQHAEMVSHQDY